MRAALLTSVLLVAFAVPAVAQAPSGSQGQQGYQGNPGYEHDQGNDGPDWPMWRDGGPHEWRGWMGDRFGPNRFPEMMHFMAAMNAGTSYRFKRGDSEVDIHCSPREPAQACVNGAIALMKALPPNGSAATSGQTQH